MNNKVEDSFWLSRWEQEEVIQSLINSEAGMIKWDNGRGLPIKSGGTTDVYINLRNARNDPRVLQLLSELYVIPLMRLRAQGFVEVPDSVSCFAGSISTRTNLPYVTIREQSKEGRVAKADLIGQLIRGKCFNIIDDVITDGASKIIPIRKCLSAGVNLGPLIVLVDRQQGWRRKFAEEKLDVGVWPAMTLHDVRRFLVRRGLMERCNRESEAKNPIIVALDGKDWSEILPIIDRLRPTGCIFKVNDLLFWEGYRSLVPDLEVYGRVMVDLKGHDIPNTLENIAKRFRSNPPWAVTIHASGGEAMIKAVVKAFEGTLTKVLAVTVLTSIDKDTCQEIYSRLPLEQVKTLAAIANRAGAHGLVCSPEEVAILKSLYPNLHMVTPGIRSEGIEKGDQKRTGTPAGALAAGASFLVMGRQILGAIDPVIEVQRLLVEEIKVS